MCCEHAYNSENYIQTENKFSISHMQIRVALYEKAFILKLTTRESLPCMEYGAFLILNNYSGLWNSFKYYII